MKKILEEESKQKRDAQEYFDVGYYQAFVNVIIQIKIANSNFEVQNASDFRFFNNVLNSKDFMIVEKEKN